MERIRCSHIQMLLGRIKQHILMQCLFFFFNLIEVKKIVKYIIFFVSYVEFVYIGQDRKIEAFM